MTVQAQFSETGTVGYLRATSDRVSKQKSECKSSTAFRTISEVATNLDVPQHVLRFWETKFHQIRPLKRGGGRRYYRPEDVALLTSIKELLYGKGMTIRGVQKLLSEGCRSEIKRVSTRMAETQDQQDHLEQDRLSKAPADSDLQSRASLSSSPFQAAEQRGLSVSGDLTSSIDSALVRATGKPQALTPQARREMENLLTELKSLRDLLRQAGV